MHIDCTFLFADTISIGVHFKSSNSLGLGTNVRQLSDKVRQLLVYRQKWTFPSATKLILFI